MKLLLGDVEETALIPLAIRANETQRKNARITDNKAVEIISRLNIVTKQYDKFMSHEGVIARTIIIDKIVKDFIEKYPNALCVNLACGLDDRFSRVDNGKILWYDIDLDDMIRIRQKVYQQTERRKMISGNALEKDYTAQIQKRENVIVIAEGLLMYFSREQVKTLVGILAEHFENGRFVCELMHPLMTGNGKYHDTVKDTNADFGWGTKSGHEIESLCDGIKLVNEISLNSVMKKYSVRGFLMSVIPGVKSLNNRIAIFKIK